MKEKIVVLIICLFFISNTIFAINLGIKGGFTLNKIIFPDRNEGVEPHKTSTSFLSGFKIGIFTEFLLSKNLSFQPNFSYTQRGYSSTYEAMSRFFFVEKTVKLYYLELSTLLKAKLNKKKFYSLYALAGPYIAYYITSVQNEHAISDAGDYYYNGEAPGYKKINMGLTFGLGTLIKTNIGNFIIETTCSYSLKNSYSHLVLSFVAGYKF